MNYPTKSVPLELKKLSDDGKFTGYGSVFSTKDQGGDIVMPGAFEKSLKKWADLDRTVPVYWQHKSEEPVGHWPTLEEDDYGLLGDAELWLDDAPYARTAYRGMKTKSITGLSIGYRVKRAEYDKKAAANRLFELELIEISVVGDPMHSDARIATVKSMIESGNMPTLREFEEFLRDAGGFSKAQAEKIASNGLKQLLRGDPGSDPGEATKAILDILNSAHSKLTR